MRKKDARFTTARFVLTCDEAVQKVNINFCSICFLSILNTVTRFSQAVLQLDMLYIFQKWSTISLFFNWQCVEVFFYYEIFFTGGS